MQFNVFVKYGRVNFELIDVLNTRRYLQSSTAHAVIRYPFGAAISVRSRRVLFIVPNYPSAVFDVFTNLNDAHTRGKLSVAVEW